MTSSNHVDIQLSPKNKVKETETNENIEKLGKKRILNQPNSHVLPTFQNIMKNTKKNLIAAISQKIYFTIISILRIFLSLVIIMFTAIQQALNIILLVIHSIKNCIQFFMNNIKRTNKIFLFIETYQKGPEKENQNHWNFLIWRLIFPLFTIVVCLFVVLLGQLNIYIYTLLVCPIWYLVNFSIILYPFLILYNFTFYSVLDNQSKIWKSLAIISITIGFLEYLFTSKKDKISWIIGTTLYGIFGLIGLPVFFQCKSRSIKRNLGYLFHFNDNEKHHDNIDNETTLNNNEEQVSSLLNETNYSSNSNLPTSQVESMHHTFITNKEKMMINETSQYKKPEIFDTNLKIQSNKYMAHISIISIFIVWIMSCMDYLTPKTNFKSIHNTNINWRWYLIYFLSPLYLCFYFIEKKKSNYYYNFQYVIFYVTTIIHIPVFLGHLFLHFFSVTESQKKLKQHDMIALYSSSIRFIVSVVFLVIMQCYFYFLTITVQNMSEPFAHPSLLYIGQLYYYMFWYMLVSNDEPIDHLYWAMLLVSNIHIVLSNTGLYNDMITTGSTLLTGVYSLPKYFSMGSSGAFFYRCFKNTKSKHLDDDSYDYNDKNVKYKTESSIFCKKNKNLIKKLSNKVNYSKSTQDEFNFKFENNTNDTYMNERSTTSELAPLYFLMKMAEQDNMADTSALILIPSLLTIITFLKTPNDEDITIIKNKINLWLRCIFMFLGRIFSSYLAREIFAYKLRSRLENNIGYKNNNRKNQNIIKYKEHLNHFGSNGRLYIQKIMLEDFQEQFWFLTAVTIVCTFSCFEKLNVPSRFAFINKL